MEYSKLFLGLPELTNEIIKYFRNDFSTLHSCMLVNRLWCRLTIPLLWEDPFSIPTENYHFIYVYLNNLNQHDKLLLKEYGIKSNSFLTNNNSTLFNYPYYIKYLNTWKIIESIEKWVKEVKIIKYQNDINLIRLIYKSLFKVFIENEVILNTFEIEMDTNMDYDYFNVAFELILNHPGFINNIKILKLYFGDLTRFDNLLSLLSNYDTFQNNLCQIDTFKLFFQKCADYLENFGFNFNSLNDELRRELLEQVLNYCTKIKFFESSENNHYRLFLSFDIIENIFHYLNYLTISKKYIMKKKRVKYLAFKDMDDLFYMKDKVEEFKSFDIEIQDYDILITYCYEYIEETY
ncbi:hypothetical protein GLOIN_2v1886066 [Rhizophagus clarus]|uniref:F-box domain-containing protein n=1 Tax=Rhizophagus clarus TaxID=94130 RepID=A0A8H3QGR4_9GLOM|nr:hypothetical protein GLOIN_2v1886066 [Rhizophagus clarus]